MRFALFFLLTLTFWLGILFLFEYILGNFNEVEVFGPYLVKKLLSMLFLSFFILLIISNIITSLSHFYLSKDLEFVCSLPIQHRSFFYSRLFMTLMDSSWMLLIFGLPVFIAYGVVHEAGFTFYLFLFIIIPPFLMIPASIGTIISTILSTIFPARKMRDALILTSILFISALYIFIRVLKPEKLVQADSFETIVEFLSSIKTPTSTLMPNYWALESLYPLLKNEGGEYLLYFFLLLTGGLTSAIIAMWLLKYLYLTARSKSQESKEIKFSRFGLLDRLFSFLFKKELRDAGNLILKDIKVFLRDSSQWTQLFLILALVIVYLYSVKALPLKATPLATLKLQNIVAFLNVGMSAFVMSAVAVRFLFTSISVEGRAIWILLSSPFTIRRFLWTKFLTGFFPLLLLSEILVVISNILLETSSFIMFLSAGMIFFLTFCISGLSTGLGALYPNFDAENVARIPTGPGGILLMVLSMGFIAGAIILVALPVYWFITAQFYRTNFSLTQMTLSVLFIITAGSINIAGGIIPLRLAERRLIEGFDV